MSSMSVYLDKYFSDFMMHIWSLSVGLIGLDSRGQRGFVAQKTPFLERTWNFPDFLLLTNFTSGRDHQRHKILCEKKLLDSPGYRQRRRALKAHYSSIDEDNFGFQGRCEFENSILDFRIFEELHIACSNIWKLQLIERKVAAQKTGALWAPGGQIDSQVKMLLFFLLVFLLSIMLMMPRYHFVWTWPPWLGRHAPPGCWSARRRCSSHWWPSPRPATLHQPRPGEEVHRAQLAEWTSWLIFPTTIICQKGFWSELKSFLPADQDQDHSKDQDQGQGQGQG